MGNPTDKPGEERPVTPGQVFHGLEIISLIARGGMGIVYKARHPRLDRLVALKLLPRSMATDEDFRRRFDREARALAGLSHPNIVSIYDSGIEDDLPFLVMAFVDGTTLRQVLKSGGLAPEEALKLVPQLGQAIHYAHAQGVVHRDIKPENILIDRQGQVKITDFGLAKLLRSDAIPQSESNLVVGTPHYMSPEQLERPREVDHRADIYSLGVVCYELLARELPIGRFQPPSKKCEVDPRLDEVILRALEKEPDRRYQSMAEFLEAFERAGGGRPSPRKVSPTARQRYAQNIQVQCACGWLFYVPGTTRGLIPCPSCHRPVPALSAPGAQGSGASDGPRPVLAPPKDRVVPLLVTIAGTVLALLVAVTLIVATGSRRKADTAKTSPPPRPAVRPQSPPAYTPPKEAPPPPGTPLPPLPRPPPPQPLFPERSADPPPPGTEGGDPAHRLDQAVSRSNLSLVVATVLFHTGRVLEHDQLQARIRVSSDEARRALAKIEASGQPAPSLDFAESGDRLLSLGSISCTPDRVELFVEELKSWMRRFKAGVTETCRVTRRGETVTFVMQFPERTKELQAIAHLLEILLGEGIAAPLPAAPPIPEVPVAPVGEFPAALLADLRSRLNALPPYYREAMPAEDKDRMRKLMESGKGMPEDEDFLRQRIGVEVLGRHAEEFAGIASRITDLESQLPASADADVVTYKDGHKVECTVEEVTEEFVKIRRRIGASMVGLKVPAATIAKIERGKGGAGEFKGRFDASRGKPEVLLELAAWCAERKLGLQKDLVLWSTLHLDPGNAKARMELGFSKNAAGLWQREAEVTVQEGRVQWNGKWYPPEQFAKQLRSLGYVELNGVWCEKVPFSYKIDNLYRDEGRLVLVTSDTTVMSKVQTLKDSVYDVRSRAWVPKTKQVPVARYIGTQSTGTCHVEIRAPGDIVDCRVKAKGQVSKVGDRVIVSVATHTFDPMARALYSLVSPGVNESQFDVGEKVRGRPVFFLRVILGGEGMFLPADSNDLGVLEVRGTYGRPLERVNAALGLKRSAAEDSAPVAGPPGGIRGLTPEATVQVTRRAAESATATFTQFKDVVVEMVRATAALAYPGPVSPSTRYPIVAAAISDPLQPRLDQLPRQTLTELGAWWSGLTVAERRDFAEFYGLWCARTRYEGGGR